MLERIKTLLDIKDTLQDDPLNEIIDNVTAHLTYLLGKDVPDYLSFIVVEISVMRYNRRGAEGMKSELVEGHRTDFHDPEKDFQPYLSIIDKEVKKDDGEPKHGKVMFI